MGGYCILILISLNYCFAEWILVPAISSEKDNVLPKKEFKYTFKTITEINNQSFCPDFHNLTVLGYSSEEKTESSNEWKISIEDFNELMKENKKIPKTSSGKASFVSRIEKTLQDEAEKQIKNLFHPGDREARFTNFLFPSIEGSLMTISMLIFGVYLTKLILKLLQSHNAKYNMPIRMMGGVRAPIILTQNRQTRSAEMDMQKLHFMYIIDKYNSKFN